MFKLWELHTAGRVGEHTAEWTLQEERRVYLTIFVLQSVSFIAPFESQGDAEHNDTVFVIGRLD